MRATVIATLVVAIACLLLLNRLVQVWVPGPGFNQEVHTAVAPRPVIDQ